MEHRVIVLLGVLVAVCTALPVVSVQEEVEETATTSPGAGWMYRALTEGLLQLRITSQEAKCGSDGAKYHSQLGNLTLWAARMFDASALSPNGFVSGDTYQFGHFDECISIEVPKEQITGKYCLASLQYGPDPQTHPGYYEPPKSLYVEPDTHASVWEKLKVTKDRRQVPKDVLHMAVCVPSSCPAQDIQDSLAASISGPLAEAGLVAKITIRPQDCYSVWEQPPLNTGYFSVIGILYFMFFVCISATLLDYIAKDRTAVSGSLRRFIEIFSTYENARKLIRANPEADFKILHFLKFFSMFCVILGHKEMYSFGNPTQNTEFIESFYSNWTSMIFLNGGGFVVDTFFVYSGFLTTHFLLLQLKSKKNINFAVLIFGKILRILPVYLFVIAFHATVLPYLGSGPLWNSLVWREALRCQKNWWLNLLFLNNYVDVEETCMIQAWYLAADMHFFIIGIVLVYIQYKHPRLGCLLIAAASAAAVAIPTYITYVNQYKGVVRLYHDLQADPPQDEHFRSMYAPSHARFIPYMVGILMAYVFRYLTRINFTIPGKFLVFLIPFLSLVNLCTIFMAVVFYVEERPYSLFENVLYAGVHRIIWSVTISCIVLIDTTCNIGKWRSILRHRIWAPLGRLTYCAFLVHTIPLLYTTGHHRSSFYHTRMTATMTTLGEVAHAFAYALFLNLVFESPLQRIQKIIFKRLMEAPKKSGLAQQNIAQVIDSQLTLTSGISKITIIEDIDPKMSVEDYSNARITFRDENGIYKG